MDKIKIATVNEVELKKQLFKKVLGKSYLIRKIGGGYEVLEYMCRHQGADLNMGKEENGIVTCPRHHWKYSKDSGENIEGDGQPLKKCEVEILGENIYILLDLCNQEY